MITGTPSPTQVVSHATVSGVTQYESRAKPSGTTRSSMSSISHTTEFGAIKSASFWK
jgi:hypothetical protein